MELDLYAYQPVRRTFEDVVALLALPERLLQPATDAVSGAASVLAEPGELQHDDAGGRWLPLCWTTLSGPSGDRVVEALLAITPPVGSAEPTHLFLAATCRVGARGAAQAFVTGFLAKLAHLMEEVPPRPHTYHGLLIELDESFSTEWALEESPL